MPIESGCVSVVGLKVNEWSGLMPLPPVTAAWRTEVTPVPSTVTWMSKVGFRSIETKPGSTGKLASVNDCEPLSHTFAGPPTGGSSQGIVKTFETRAETDVAVFDQSPRRFCLPTGP